MPYIEDRGGLDLDGKDPWKGYPVAIVERVLPLCRTILGRRALAFGPDSRFVTGWDSLELVELVMAIEDEFSIMMFDEDAQSIETVGQLIQYVKDRTG